MEGKKYVPSKEEHVCHDCNVELIPADYSDDPELLMCPKCEDEFR